MHVFFYLIYPVFYLWEINSLAFCGNYYYLGFCKCKVFIVQFYLYHKWFSINSRWLLQNDPKSQQFSVICREEAPVFALCRPCALHWRGEKDRNLSFFSPPSRPITKSIAYKIIICKSCFRNLTFLFFLLLKWEIECWVDKIVWDNIQPQILITLSRWAWSLNPWIPAFRDEVNFSTLYWKNKYRLTEILNNFDITNFIFFF